MARSLMRALGIALLAVVGGFVAKPTVPTRGAGFARDVSAAARKGKNSRANRGHGTEGGAAPAVAPGGAPRLVKRGVAFELSERTTFP